MQSSCIPTRCMRSPRALSRSRMPPARDSATPRGERSGLAARSQEARACLHHREVQRLPLTPPHHLTNHTRSQSTLHSSRFLSPPTSPSEHASLLHRACRADAQKAANLPFASERDGWLRRAGVTVGGRGVGKDRIECGAEEDLLLSRRAALHPHAPLVCVAVDRDGVGGWILSRRRAADDDLAR